MLDPADDARKGVPELLVMWNTARIAGGSAMSTPDTSDVVASMSRASARL
jgi:hypothetical protein